MVDINRISTVAEHADITALEEQAASKKGSTPLSPPKPVTGLTPAEVSNLEKAHAFQGLWNGGLPVVYGDPLGAGIVADPSAGANGVSVRLTVRGGRFDPSTAFRTHVVGGSLVSPPGWVVDPSDPTQTNAVPVNVTFNAGSSSAVIGVSATVIPELVVGGTPEDLAPVVLTASIVIGDPARPVVTADPASVSHSGSDVTLRTTAGIIDASTLRIVDVATVIGDVLPTTEPDALPHVSIRPAPGQASGQNVACVVDFDPMVAGAVGIYGHVTPPGAPAALPFLAPLTILALPTDGVVSALLQHELGTLHHVLAGPGNDVRAVVPLLPVVPQLIGPDGVIQVPTLDVSTAGLGLSSLPLQISADLSVNWSVQGAPGGPPPPLVARNGDGTPVVDPSAALSGLGVLMQLLPTSGFDPLAAGAAHFDTVTVGATVTLTATVPGTAAVPATTAAAQRSLETHDVTVGLPVPAVFMLSRCPNFELEYGADTGGRFFDAGANRGLDGAFAINIPNASDQLEGGLVDPASITATGYGALAWVPGAGGLLQRLGLPFAMLAVANGPVHAPGAVDGQVGGLTALRDTVSALPRPLPAAAEQLLALADAIDILVAAATAAIQRGISHDNRPDAFIRLLYGVGPTGVAHADIPFIQHEDVWHGTDVNIEDETEAAVLVGPPGTHADVFVHRDFDAGSGAATITTGSGFCAVVPSLGALSSAMGDQPGSAPAASAFTPGYAPLGQPGFYGTVSITTAITSDRTTWAPGGGPASDSLARTISSWRVT